MRYAVYSNKGKVRIDNEDNYLIKEKSVPLFAVADGMGGHQAGEIASQIAVQSLEKYDFDYENILDEIKSSINRANDLIYEQGQKELEFEGMGTTLSMGIIYNMQLFIGHVGDSRIYLHRDKQLKQLTTDHSLVNELVENNQITCQEAFDHPQKNIITQALGTSEKLKIDSKVVELKNGDLILFSTDGLHDMLRLNEIEDILNSNENIEELVKLLGEQALNKGGSDNITLIIVELK
ncbi:MAG: Stp1/IreP family PP2C-type Ser/Thr phosphatase [bacterium]